MVEQSQQTLPRWDKILSWTCLILSVHHPSCCPSSLLAEPHKVATVLADYAGRPVSGHGAARSSPGGFFIRTTEDYLSNYCLLRHHQERERSGFIHTMDTLGRRT